LTPVVRAWVQFWNSAVEPFFHHTVRPRTTAVARSTKNGRTA
ncbi:hypothetical protein T05_1262, partial [Trichinella murrelli]